MATEPKRYRGALLTPLMVDKSTAAQLCSMSVATYEKYAKQNLLPPMNATGRISVEALRQAVCRLDGFMQDSAEDPEAALAKWEAENAN